MRKLSIAILAALSFFAFAPTADAGNYIIYVQGRGWQNWNGEVANVSGWTNITLSFNGNAKLNGTATNVTVKNAIASYCSSGNNCIVHCYSAGCLRTLKAVSDLRASGNTLPGLLWSEASASAAGGTKLASIATKGFTGFLAKLLGQQEKIDYDLTPSAARNNWGYVQDDMGTTMYHTAGKKNICKKILWVIKICGNKYVDAGVGDGVVGLDSASGGSLARKVWNGCSEPKYPYRTYDANSPCGGENRDHFGMPGRGSAIIAASWAGTAVDSNRSWGDSTSNPDCNDAAGECDGNFDSCGQDFSKTPALSTVSTDISGTSSNTTCKGGAGSCYGSCGSFAGTCWCDAACTYFGDCCGDYGAAKCGEMNGGGYCAGNCGGYASAGACWCDQWCVVFGDCCAGATGECGI